MSGLEANKIIGAVLGAGVIALTSGFVTEIVTHREHLAESAYPVAVTANVAAPSEAPAGPSLDPVLPLLAAADLAAGKKVAKKCTSCHTFDEGGANKIGPNLWGVVGRDVAALGGFAYSPAMQGKADEAWSYQNLNAFLARPKDWVPKTKMTFAGLKKVRDRANLIAYLREQSGSPMPLPE